MIIVSGADGYLKHEMGELHARIAVLMAQLDERDAKIADLEKQLADAKQG